jgi:hypothetical protein
MPTNQFVLEKLLLEIVQDGGSEKQQYPKSATYDPATGYERSVGLFRNT